MMLNEEEKHILIDLICCEQTCILGMDKIFELSYASDEESYYEKYKEKYKMLERLKDKIIHMEENEHEN